MDKTTKEALITQLNDLIDTFNSNVTWLQDYVKVTTLGPDAAKIVDDKIQAFTKEIDSYKEDLAAIEAIEVK